MLWFQSRHQSGVQLVTQFGTQSRHHSGPQFGAQSVAQSES